MKGLLSRQLWRCGPDPLLRCPCRQAEGDCGDVRVKTTQNNRDVVKHSDILILAVKPQILKQVVGEMAEQLNPSKLVISLPRCRDGIDRALCKERREIDPGDAHICVSVGEGIAAISANKMATPDDQKVAKAIFDSCREIALHGGALLDAVTASAEADRPMSFSSSTRWLTEASRWG